MLHNKLINESQFQMEESSFEIRRADWDKMKIVAGFIRSSADWYKPFIDKKDYSEHEVGREWIEKNYGRREFYIGSDNGVPVGTISYQTIGDYAYLGYIYLDTRFVGKGYGRQLMVFAKRLAEERGKKGMVLIAHPKATWATKAYKKFGFDLLAKKKEKILSWNNGALKPYYEEGFELYQYAL